MKLKIQYSDAKEKGYATRQVFIKKLLISQCLVTLYFTINCINISYSLPTFEPR